MSLGEARELVVKAHDFPKFIDILLSKCKRDGIAKIVGVVDSEGKLELKLLTVNDFLEAVLSDVRVDVVYLNGDNAPQTPMKKPWSEFVILTQGLRMLKIYVLVIYFRGKPRKWLLKLCDLVVNVE
jgi:hypothetical protein